MRMTFVGRWAAAIAILCWPVVGAAQVHAVDTTFRDFMHARSYGTGGAYRGLGLGADVVDGNPAAMSLYPRYQTELGGAWEIDGRLAFGDLALVDSQSNRIAAGVSYHFALIGKGSDSRSVHLETIAVGVPVTDWIHFGMSVHHILMSAGSDAKGANAITGDAGLMFRILNMFNLGLSAHNIIDTNHPELARYFVLSSAYVGELFTADFDLRADFGVAPGGVGPADYTGPETTQLSWSAGAEYILGIFPVRAGYQHDAILGADYLSFGLGVMTETGNIDLAYRFQLGGQAKLIALTVRLGN